MNTFQFPAARGDRPVVRPVVTHEMMTMVMALTLLTNPYDSNAPRPSFPRYSRSNRAPLNGRERNDFTLSKAVFDWVPELKRAIPGPSSKFTRPTFAEEALVALRRTVPGALGLVQDGVRFSHSRPFRTRPNCALVDNACMVAIHDHLSNGASPGARRKREDACLMQQTRSTRSSVEGAKVSSRGFVNDVCPTRPLPLDHASGSMYLLQVGPFNPTSKFRVGKSTRVGESRQDEGDPTEEGSNLEGCFPPGLVLCVLCSAARAALPSARETLDRAAANAQTEAKGACRSLEEQSTMFGGSGGFDAGTQFAGGGFMPTRCEAEPCKVRGDDKQEPFGFYLV